MCVYIYIYICRYIHTCSIHTDIGIHTEIDTHTHTQRHACNVVLYAGMCVGMYLTRFCCDSHSSFGIPDLRVNVDVLSAWAGFCRNPIKIPWPGNLNKMLESIT